jgi:hypothetical protein
VRESVRLRREGDDYVVAWTPSEFDLVSRVLQVTFGAGSGDEVARFVVGEATPRLLAWRDQRVDPYLWTEVEAELTHAELRTVYAALSHAYLGRTSEAEFHAQFGFSRENVQALALAIAASVEAIGATS